METSMGGNIIIWAIYNIICVASEIHLTVLVKRCVNITHDL